MNATFRQLRLFLAFAEHLSVTAAARACHVTQPTASMQLRELAEGIGMPLYEQVGKRLYLTAAGEALARTARAMMDEWTAFEQHMDGIQGMTRGRLRLSVVSTAKYFVPRLLGTFCAAFPDIDIALEVLNRDGVLRRLHENLDDLYIMSMPPSDLELERHAFLANPLDVIASASHPLVGRERIALAELGPLRFILREKGSGTRLACDRHFRALGFRADIRMELGSNEAIKQAVAASLGLGVISRHALGERPEEEQLVTLPVEGFPVQSNWWTLYRKGKRLSPVATAFLHHLEHAGQAEVRKS
ncbi:LysR family transcriptional regulator [Massilia sp. LC238]|uniref:LysR family transcriptional regulator n=1 Tax=Massilia sp. LC238 TaxID=1502852 RepID=UPI0004E37646|nr:LysR family transcriptional regulator [Massilia sp. LC238]KFC73486.1 Transcriptional regulator, LysR family [Massilia sp. LC238]